MIRSLLSSSTTLVATALLALAPACVVVADGPGGDGGGGDEGEGEGEGEGVPAVEPLPVVDEDWTYTIVDGASCGNGDPVGVATNRGKSSRLVLYLEGGGACWNAFTCGNGFAVFVDTGVPASVVRQITSLSVGLFDRRAVANPFADDSFAYVPYCTGDIHTGHHADTPWGVHHVGAQNLAAMLPRILATFPDVEEVVFTGASAGGYGVTYNAPVLRSLLSSTVTLSLLIDSAIALPPFPGGEPYAAEQVAAWEPEMCDGCDTVDEVFDATVALLPDTRIGLVQSNADPTLRQFYAPDGRQLSIDVWKAAVDTFVADRALLPNVRFFITAETRHVYGYDEDFSATVVDGVSLADFMSGVVGDTSFVSAITP